MRVGILATSNGTHPPSKWAAESAAQIADVIQIDPTSIVFDSMTAAKTEFQTKVEAALLASHQTVQDHEKAAIDKHGHDRLSHPLAPEASHLDEAVAAVLGAASGSMFASHFSKPEVQQFVRSTLGSHFATVRHIERSTHADKYPNEPKAKAFRAQYHG